MPERPIPFVTVLNEFEKNTVGSLQQSSNSVIVWLYRTRVLSAITYAIRAYNVTYILLTSIEYIGTFNTHKDVSPSLVWRVRFGGGYGGGDSGFSYVRVFGTPAFGVRY